MPAKLTQAMYGQTSIDTSFASSYVMYAYIAVKITITTIISSDIRYSAELKTLGHSKLTANWIMKSRMITLCLAIA